MEDKREILDPEQQAEMHDLFEAIVDLLGRNDNGMNVTMHALCRAVAYGGVQLNHYDTVTKRQFVSMVVESVSAHYDTFQSAIKTHGGLND